MPRYKLRLVEPGDYLYCEGEAVYVGGLEDAKEFYVDEGFEDEDFWVHPEILRGRVVYARDIENDDAHEDAEPGDTTYDYVTMDPTKALGPLGKNEVRSWPRGAWSPGWVMSPPWCSSGSGYEVVVAGEVIGNEYASLEAAEAVCRARVAELVAAWKVAHPQYRCEIPKEAPDA